MSKARVYQLLESTRLSSRRFQIEVAPPYSAAPVDTGRMLSKSAFEQINNLGASQVCGLLPSFLFHTPRSYHLLHRRLAARVFLLGLLVGGRNGSRPARPAKGSSDDTPRPKKNLFIYRAKNTFMNSGVCSFSQVWAEVTALAQLPGVLDLGQGWPDFGANETARRAASEAILSEADARSNQYSPIPVGRR